MFLVYEKSGNSVNNSNTGVTDKIDLCVFWTESLFVQEQVG